jgi:histidyl-tRNA synthetase
VGDQNCRPQYVALLKEKLRDVASKLCGDCQRRAETNPLRVLDCKVPEDQEIINALPSIQDHLCDPCRTHFAAVCSHLDDRGIPYEIKPRMVRGLDYYMRTTFEIVHGALGAQNSVLGGGRYDGLAEALGSKVPAPGIGFSIGEDRLVMSVEQEHPESYKPAVDIYIAPLGALAERHSAQLAQTLRAAGCSVELGLDSKLKRSLELANKMSARFALIVGENEIAAGRYTIKNMQSGEQQTVTREELTQRIK